MSWGLGWKRPSEVFHLALSYGSDEFPDEGSPKSSRSSSSQSGGSPLSDASPTKLFQEAQQQLGFRIEIDWNAGDDEDQVALKLQSQLMVGLPSPQDTVEIELTERCESGDAEDCGKGEVGVEMRVVKRREPLKGVLMWKAGTSGHQADGVGVFLKLMRSNFCNDVVGSTNGGEEIVGGCAEHWRSVTVVSLSGLGLTVGSFFIYYCILYLNMSVFRCFSLDLLMLK